MTADDLSTTGISATTGRPAFWPSVARWVASVANSWAHFLPLLVVSPFSRRAAWAIFRNWNRIGGRIFGCTSALRDDNAGDRGPHPHLYVMLNQSSLAETLALSILLPPHHTIINLEYAALPLLGWARVLLGDLVIVRQWKQQAKRGIERAASRLASGQTWMISIEGARSPDGRLSPYKKGPVVMALQSRATLIPMIIRGSREILPPGEWRVRPGHIEVHMLDAIPTRGLGYDDRDAVLERLRRLAEHELAYHGSPPLVAVGVTAPGSLEVPHGGAGGT